MPKNLTDQKQATPAAKNMPWNGMLLQRTCACGNHSIGGACEECRKKRDGLLQRAEVDQSPVNEVPPIVYQVLQSPGHPLDPGTRADMEPGFRQDFSQVRVHTDSTASASARAVNALAYTVGNNIVFGAGQYSPATSPGRRLIAHELTHVQQQSTGRHNIQSYAGEIVPGKVNDRYEKEAEETAQRVTNGGQAGMNSAVRLPGSWLQRQADISLAPRGLACTLVTGSSRPSGTNILFAVNSARVTPAFRDTIRGFAETWLTGARDLISIDGYASEDGPQELNWRLSCDRANAVRSLLIAFGIPDDRVQVAAHGETAEFGDASQNRLVVLSTFGPISVRQEPPSAPAPPVVEDYSRDRQVRCVWRLGGCPNSRPGGLPSPEEIEQYNSQCRPESRYTGPNVTPTDEECRNPPDPPEPPGPIEVTAVDDSDYVGWIASAVRIGEVYMTDVRSMVENVLTAAGNQPISRLNILDHGNSQGIQIGNDWITTANVANFVPQLSRLRGHFTSGGIVHIQHCEAGQNQELVCTLASAFGVPVYAGTGLHNPLYRINFGDYVRCDPNGDFHTDVGRP